MEIESIRHDPEQCRFELATGGRTAVIEYRPAGNTLVFTHTWTPPELRGRGIAAQLMEAAFSFARAEGKKIVPQCSYVEAYLRRHPEHEDLRA